MSTYLKEEIREEGLVRNVPPFLRFLSVAGQLNGQLVHGQNIARESSFTAKHSGHVFLYPDRYASGSFFARLAARTESARGRTYPKFYWFDPGFARDAAGLIREPTDRLWQGTALETLIFHELRVCYNESSRKKRPLAYYRTARGVEIDFVVETRKRHTDGPAHLVAIEVKRAEKWNRGWESGLRDLAESGRSQDRSFDRGLYRRARLSLRRP